MPDPHTAAPAMPGSTAAVAAIEARAATWRARARRWRRPWSALAAALAADADTAAIREGARGYSSGPRLEGFGAWGRLERP